MKFVSPLVILGLLALFGSQKPETAKLAAETPVVLDSETKIDTLAATLSWVESMQSPSGLMESAEGTGFVSLYDNALAAILFIWSGEPARAQQIFNYFQDRMDAEFEQTGGGFFQFRHISGSDPSRIWIGDNAWLLLALHQYREVYNDTRYAAMSQALEGWLRSKQQADGSLASGINEDGSAIPLITEGMLTAYQAIPGNDAFHQKILEYLSQHRWDGTLNQFMTDAGGTRYTQALDLHSLPALIWPGTKTPFLQSASQFHTTQTHSVHGHPVAGYCFDRDLDVVWLEGTAQMALAQSENNMHAAYQTTSKNLQNALVPGLEDPTTLGMPYAANPGSSFGAGALWSHAHTRPALSATVWYLFTRLKRNPLQTGEPVKPAPVPDS